MVFYLLFSLAFFLSSIYSLEKSAIIMKIRTPNIETSIPLSASISPIIYANDPKDDIIRDIANIE